MLPVTEEHAAIGANDRYHILVVDDEEHVASTTARMLEDRGFDVEWVSNGIEALSYVSNNPDDVDGVVSDFVMRRPDGLELLKSVRRIQPRLPFVLYTGRGSETIASEAIKAGVTDYIQKGGTETYDLLENTLRNAIRQARIHEELEETRARFEALMQITDAAVVTIDESRAIRYANDGVQTHFGYEPRDLRGTALEELVPDENRAAFEAGVTRYFERGDPMLDWDDIEFPLLDADGTRVQVSISLGSHATEDDHLVTAVLEPVEDDDGTPFP